jgi:hypothetical protein
MQKNKKLNKQQKVAHSRGVSNLEVHWRRGEGQEADIHTDFSKQMAGKTEGPTVGG